TSINPHRAFRTADVTKAPSTMTTEFHEGQYNSINKLDGSTMSNPYKIAGLNSGQLFSFNVIEQVERTLGIIPGGTVAEKTRWLRDNSDILRLNWFGYGIGRNGNLANLRFWNFQIAEWVV